LNNQNLLDLETHERAKQGLFVSWQTPPEISGITAFGLIRDVKKISGSNMAEELSKFKDLLSEVDLPSDWSNRQVNVGGSGGERKRAELVNLSSLDPRIAILDEIDTGLDTNGLKTVCKIINRRRGEGKINLVITHNKNLLEHLDFDTGFIFKGRNLTNVSKDEIQHTLTHGYT
jgi:Fe-S cluster assembly ATP-binding protein